MLSVRSLPTFLSALSATIIALLPEIALADALCGDGERAYMAKLVTGLQPYAHQVTPTGKFSVKDEYGSGTMALLISFSDKGKQLFTYRAGDTDGWAAVAAKPVTKSGQPAFTFSFAQGKIGACESDVFVKDGTFVSTQIRTVMSRR